MDAFFQVLKMVLCRIFPTEETSGHNEIPDGSEVSELQERKLKCFQLSRVITFESFHSWCRTKFFFRLGMVHPSICIRLQGNKNIINIKKLLS